MLTYRKRKAFSLIELVIVIIIIGVLGGIGAGFGGRQVANARMSTVSSNLQIVASDVESAVLDLGFVDDVTDAAAVKRYFTSWDAKYLTCPLDLDNISEAADYGDYKGVSIHTLGYADPWENEYVFYYLVATGEDEGYRIIIASAGPNGQFAESEASAYVGDDADFEDDVVMVMEPRG